VDVFCRFIHDKGIRTFIAQEFAFTFDISKDQVAFFSIIHKPAISLKSSGLQVERVIVLLSFSPPSLSPLNSVTHHTSTLLESVAMAVTNMEPVLLVVETGMGKTAELSPKLPAI
jgi:midasin (ATPase involved in ribosome maturation)